MQSFRWSRDTARLSRKLWKKKQPRVVGSQPSETPSEYRTALFKINRDNNSSCGHPPLEQTKRTGGSERPSQASQPERNIPPQVHAVGLQAVLAGPLTSAACGCSWSRGRGEGGEEARADRTAQLLGATPGSTWESEPRVHRAMVLCVAVAHTHHHHCRHTFLHLFRPQAATRTHAYFQLTFLRC